MKKLFMFSSILTVALLASVFPSTSSDEPATPVEPMGQQLTGLPPGIQKHLLRGKGVPPGWMKRDKESRGHSDNWKKVSYARVSTGFAIPPHVLRKLKKIKGIPQQLASLATQVEEAQKTAREAAKQALLAHEAALHAQAELAAYKAQGKSLGESLVKAQAGSSISTSTSTQATATQAAQEATEKATEAVAAAHKAGDAALQLIEVLEQTSPEVKTKLQQVSSELPPSTASQVEATMPLARLTPAAAEEVKEVAEDIADAVEEEMSGAQ